MRYSLANNELKALIRLLDDPDTGVYENVSSKLISFGKNVIPHLESEWEIIDHNTIQDRIEEIIHQIEFDSCKQALSVWKEEGYSNLLEGAIIASMFQYPEQPIDLMNSKLELLRKDVWLELNDNLTSLEKVRV